jgi:hypothetical protein
VLAWHALTRSPNAPAYLRPEKFSDFEAVALEVRDADSDKKTADDGDESEGDDETGTPTRPDLESGY